MQATLSRHVQVELRPLYCGVDSSRIRTGLNSLDTSKCSTGLGEQVSQGSVSRQIQMQKQPLQCRHIPGATQAPLCRHIHGPLRSLCCSHLQEQHLLLFSIQAMGEAQVPVVWTCPTQAFGNVYTAGDDSQELFQHIQDRTKDELLWQKFARTKWNESLRQ